MTKRRGTASSAPARQHRLLALRRAIDAGRYHVPARAVAQAILRHLGIGPLRQQR